MSHRHTGAKEGGFGAAKIMKEGGSGGDQSEGQSPRRLAGNMRRKPILVQWLNSCERFMSRTLETCKPA